MTFEKLFKLLSYSAVLSGFIALWVSGTFGVFGTASFLAVMVTSWFLEGSRAQISERIGTALIVLALPAFYLGYKFQVFGFAAGGALLAGILARLILALTAIKLLQRKSDRDWIFLYLMSFFEVLLAAGLSISAMYLASFVAYIFVMVCTIIVFEIRKTNRSSVLKIGGSADATASALPAMSIRRLPATGLILIFSIILVAVPMFFLLPRVGGAGLGGNPGGASTKSGFSDKVTLGGIGRIQENDEVIMRVRVDAREASNGNLRWRGIALDTFDNKSWSRTRPTTQESKVRGERNLIQVDYPSGSGNLTLQTIYLEPLDTPVLFSLSRAIGVKSNFAVLYKDVHGAITHPPNGQRLNYEVLSDRTLPSEQSLRMDRTPYSDDTSNYLQLPEVMDARIEALAEQLTVGLNRRYDAARAIEAHLQSSYGYTLEQKSGGDEPLADFLFNVKEGHCEYFATAMAVMLRTQGIATRVVNGFQQGEYNETADVFVVKQRNAHSWVEVYFPGEDAWVPFDPTPFAAQNLTDGSTGIAGQIGKYLDALETFWIQYFVAFDNQEQRSLFTTVKRGLSEYHNTTSSWISSTQTSIAEWWSRVRGDDGFQSSAVAVGSAIFYIAAGAIVIALLLLLYRRIRGLSIWIRLRDWLKGKKSATMIEFYDRMQRVLASKGLTREPHQTPLEFAFALNMPEAVTITEKYNSVRFGERKLSHAESHEIERLIGSLEATNYTNNTN